LWTTCAAAGCTRDLARRRGGGGEKRRERGRGRGIQSLKVILLYLFLEGSSISAVAGWLWYEQKAKGGRGKEKKKEGKRTSSRGLSDPIKIALSRNLAEQKGEKGKRRDRMDCPYYSQSSLTVP